MNRAAAIFLAFCCCLSATAFGRAPSRCAKGKPCGGSCIAVSKTCRVGPGSAIDEPPPVEARRQPDRLPPRPPEYVSRIRARRTARTDAPAKFTRPTVAFNRICSHTVGTGWNCPIAQRPNGVRIITSVTPSGGETPGMYAEALAIYDDELDCQTGFEVVMDLSTGNDILYTRLLVDSKEVTARWKDLDHSNQRRSAFAIQAPTCLIKLDETFKAASVSLTIWLTDSHLRLEIQQEVESIVLSRGDIFRESVFTEVEPPPPPALKKPCISPFPWDQAEFERQNAAWKEQVAAIRTRRADWIAQATAEGVDSSDILIDR